MGGCVLRELAQLPGRRRRADQGQCLGRGPADLKVGVAEELRDGRDTLGVATFAQRTDRPGLSLWLTLAGVLQPLTFVSGMS
jgi:hypothetical protein